MLTFLETTYFMASPMEHSRDIFNIFNDHLFGCNIKGFIKVNYKLIISVERSELIICVVRSRETEIDT